MPSSWFKETEEYVLFEEDDKAKERKRHKNRRKRRREKIRAIAVSDECGDCGEIITRALAHWSILYDIPFCYLIPHEDMLPENSLRFFFLDSGWVRTMLDGALSVGRNSKSDMEHDKIFIDNVYSDAIGAASSIRSVLQRKVSDIDFSAEQPQQGLCSGFIMRSPLVLGWRGLDFEAKSSDNAVLKALRIENLAPDILLGIYIGQISSLTIYEPPEGLHFEVMRGDGGQYIRLRDKDTGRENKAEAPVRTKRYTSAPQTSSRVLDIRALAGEIGSSSEKSDSADIALQLIKLPSYAKFYEIKGGV